MSIDPSIFFEPRDIDPTLAAASTDEVRRALVLFFESLISLPYVDPEMLHFDGMAVGRTGHAGVDTTVEAWLGDDRMERRVEIAVWILYGYWGFIPVEARGVIPHLIGVVDGLPIGSQAHQGTMLALLTAHCHESLPREDRGRIKDVLLRHLERVRRDRRYEGIVYMLGSLS